MYRLYNPWSGEHLYTSSTKERNNLVDTGWNYEGVGWYAPVTSKTPVFRVYNPYNGDHHYTVSASERSKLVKVGWKDEGIGWYSDDAKGIALYRQFNPYASIGTHNYTTSKSENDSLAKIGWKPEGVSWFGVDLNAPAPADATANDKPAASNTAQPNADQKPAISDASVNQQAAELPDPASSSDADQPPAQAEEEQDVTGHLEPTDQAVTELVDDPDIEPASPDSPDLESPADTDGMTAAPSDTEEDALPDSDSDQSLPIEEPAPLETEVNTPIEEPDAGQLDGAEVPSAYAGMPAENTASSDEAESQEENSDDEQVEMLMAPDTDAQEESAA